MGKAFPAVIFDILPLILSRLDGVIKGPLFWSTKELARIDPHGIPNDNALTSDSWDRDCCITLQHLFNMAADSVAAATRQRILSSNLTRSYGTNPSEPSSGYITVTSSWASTHGLSSLGLGPDRPPLAWVGVRHQVNDQDKAGDATIVGDRSTSKRSNEQRVQ